MASVCVHILLLNQADNEKRKTGKLETFELSGSKVLSVV